jgi:hypothetical protein
LYDAYFRHEQGDETIAQISKELGMHYTSLYNHMQKHVSVRERDGVRKVAIMDKKREDIKAQVQKKHELAIDHKDVKDDVLGAAIMEDYLAQAGTLVREGKIPITAQSFLTAVRISLDYESKKKDRQLDVVKTMYRYAAGKVNDGATPTTDSRPGAGPDESGDIHNPTAGDAATRWAKAVSEKHAAPEDADKLINLQQPVGEVDVNRLPPSVASILQDRHTGSSG